MQSPQSEVHSNPIKLHRGSADLENRNIANVLQQPVTHLHSLFWLYDQPCVVLGRGQRSDAEKQRRADGLGIGICGRASGGGAVMASKNMLSITTFLPVSHALAVATLPESFAYFGECWQQLLAERGVFTQLCTSVEKPPVSLEWICFAGLSYGELVDEHGKKIVGLAQVRKRNGIAVMMGLCLAPTDWDSLISVWHGQQHDPEIRAAIESRTSNLAEHGVVLNANEIVALCQQFQHRIAGSTI